MPGFASALALVTRSDAGAETIATWRKQAAVVTTIGVWFDLSMSAGNPRPNYYASSPLVAARLAQSTDGGLYHGAAVSPATKHLKSLMALTVTSTAVPLPMTLCDYLMYYPFIDEGTVNEEQVMDNTVTLSRYSTGEGVKIMPVVVAAHVGSTTTISCRYTNQDGTSGRVTPAVNIGTQTVNGTVLTSDRATANCLGPFLPMQGADTGVRSIEGCTVSGVGDVGLFTLVLVKPLADISIRGIDAPVEVDYLRDRPSMPRIVDDAYLNFICYPSASLSGAGIHGIIQTNWSD